MQRFVLRVGYQERGPAFCVVEGVSTEREAIDAVRSQDSEARDANITLIKTLSPKPEPRITWLAWGNIPSE